MMSRGKYNKVCLNDRHRLISAFRESRDWIELAEMLGIKRQTANNIKKYKKRTSPSSTKGWTASKKGVWDHEKQVNTICRGEANYHAKWNEDQIDYRTSRNAKCFHPDNKQNSGIFFNFYKRPQYNTHPLEQPGPEAGKTWLRWMNDGKWSPNGKPHFHGWVRVQHIHSENQRTIPDREQSSKMDCFFSKRAKSNPVHGDFPSSWTGASPIDNWWTHKRFFYDLLTEDFLIWSVKSTLWWMNRLFC